MTTQSPISVDSLRAIPLFSSCPAEGLASIAAALEPVEAGPGDVIFREGDAGEELYIIASGQVRAVSDAETEKVVFAHMGPGEFFGEMSLLTGASRSAAVIATTDARLWRLAKTDFESVQKRHPEVSIEINRILGERVQRGNAQRFENEAFTLLTLTSERDEITIGRLPENDLVLSDPQVAGRHARIASMEGRWVIFDQDTTAGTYVNRQRVHVSDLKDGDEILIATHKVFLDGLSVKSFRGREGVGIDAVNLTRELRDGRRILDGISLSIQPGEFVAIVGGSGTGKTSLLHALNGFAPATSGSVLYNGLSLYRNPGLFRPLLGYVPQDDIVHPQLTVGRTLYYAAKLRLPADTRREETGERIKEVLAAVGLAEREHTEVKRLSGGQRKRASVALELLAKPRALFLDEPTSGLDPALEGRMMALFRDLTESGATVIVSTHVIQNLGLCDKIAWMTQGGRLVFFGSPAEALRHFRVQQFADIYPLLEDEETREHWVGAFKDSPAYRANVAGRLETIEEGAPEAAANAEERREAPAPAKANLPRQLLWLTVRYAETLSRDLAGLALLLLQAPAIALALLIIFGRDIFAPTSAEGGDALRGVIALHMITASAIFLGASNAAREITKEAAIYARERLVNLNVLPYVMSKLIVLSLLCLFQSVALVLIFAARVDLSSLGWEVYPGLIAAVFLTALAGLAMGLLVSAISANSDRAMATVPVLLIPQLIFAGAQVPIEKMLAPAQWISQLMISKWALQLTGRLTDLAPRFNEQFPPNIADPYSTQFDISTLAPWFVLEGLTLLMIGATVLVQKRKDVL